MLILLFLLVLLLLMSASFSGSETSYFSISPWRLKRLEKEGFIAAETAAMMLVRPERLLITILIGNETVNSIISQIGAVINRRINVHQKPGLTLLSALIAALVLMTLGEVTPKGIALRNPFGFIRMTRFFLFNWWRITSLITAPFEKIIKKIILVRSVVTPDEKYQTAINREIERYIALGEGENVITVEEGLLLNRISRLEELTASEILTPRHSLVAIEKDGAVKKALELIRKMHHSRILVYDGDIDNIIGKIVLKDMIRYAKSGSRIEIPIINLVHPVMYVPVQINLRMLLSEMQRRRETMAVIFDEYGGTLGLVTLEDIIEEVVGDIKDHKNQERDLIQPAGDDGYIVNARVLIRDLQREIGFPEEIQFAALQGYLTHLFGQLPDKGDVITDGFYNYEIISVKKQRIEKVKLTRHSKNTVPGSGAKKKD